MATRGWNDVTAADVAKMGRQATTLASKPRSKYGAVKTTVDGIVFDSKAEAGRYSYLKALERTGHITDLELQPEFLCKVSGVLICTYRADFQYRKHARTERVIEDVKGIKTPVYRLKKKLVEALHGISITEIK